ncbi:MAG TPA: copper homeostasis protein CutC [Fimbriimonadaceae bacterium]
MHIRILLEIVACSAEDAVGAQSAGADRIELCAAIELGGLTPSIGLLRQTLQECSLPIMAMVRQRPGGFCYSSSEIATMCRDASALAEAGAHGLVFGCLKGDALDLAACREVLKAGAGCQSVFHRAFDSIGDQVSALEQLIELGFTRVMTSGRAASALEGAGVLRGLAERAAGRIEVMPGGGIRAANVAEIVRLTGCSSVHAAPMKAMESDSYDGAGASQVDADGVRELRQALG